MFTASKHFARTVFGFACSLALAGTCLAAPGLALADAAPAPEADEAAAATTETADVLSLGGIQVGVPEGFIVLQLGDEAAVASNEDGSTLVSIVASPEGAVSTDADELAAYIDTEIASTAEFLGAEVTGTTTFQLDEETTAYAAIIESDDIFAALLLVPQDDGALTTLFLFTTDTSAENIEYVSSISDTLAAAEEEDSEEAVALEQDVEAAGLAFSLPADFTVSDEDEWCNADETMYLGASVLTEDATDLDQDALDLIAAATAEALGGSLLGSTVLDNDGTTVYLYALALVPDDEVYLGGLGVVPTTDGGCSMVYSACVGTAADELGGVFDAIYESIRAL